MYGFVGTWVGVGEKFTWVIWVAWIYRLLAWLSKFLAWLPAGIKLGMGWRESKILRKFK